MEHGNRPFGRHEGEWVTPEKMLLPSGWKGMKVLERATKHGVSPTVVKDIVDNLKSSVWKAPGREPVGSGVSTYHTVGYSGERVYHIIYALKETEAKLVHACPGFCADDVREAVSML